MEEDNKYSRLPNSLIVSYHVLKSFLWSSSRSKHLSEDGICLSVFQRFEPGATLELKIQLPEFTEPIVVVGQVKQLKETNNRDFPFEIEIQFIQIAPVDRNKLRDHIRNISRDNRSKDIEWGA